MKKLLSKTRCIVALMIMMQILVPFVASLEMGLRFISEDDDAVTDTQAESIQEENDSISMEIKRTEAHEPVPVENGLIEVKGVLELTVDDPFVCDFYKSFTHDSRNEYLILPVHILNLSHDAMDAAEKLSPQFRYEDYCLIRFI